MKSIFRLVFVSIIFICFSACSSSPYRYTVDPSTIQKGITKYSVSEVKVKLSKFRVNLTGDADTSSYFSEEDMEKEFRKKITDSLLMNNIYDNSKNAAYQLKIQISYERTFAVNSSTVIEPEFSYTWEIINANTAIVEYSTGRMKLLTGPMGLGNFTGYVKGFSSTTNPEDEVKYIDQISKYIVEKNILNVGK